MSRPKRLLRRRFEIFCEGDTEYRYFEGMRTRQSVELALRPINMKGGGYASFLKELKTKGQVNCVARFIIVDGDRIVQHAGEARAFAELVDYCREQNQKGGIPCIIILNNPNFEFVACLHAENYAGQPVERFIRDVMGFDDLAAFKKKEDIFSFLNMNGYSFGYVIARMRGAPKPLYHRYTIKRMTVSVEVKETVYPAEEATFRGSNLDEFFDVINWPPSY